MTEMRFWDSNNFVAMVGGMMPTLCSVGSHYAVQPNAPWPQPGLLIAAVVFAIVGLAAAHGLSPTDRRQAFALGISAPAIIASIISGANKSQVVSYFELTSPAYAQSTNQNTINTPTENPSVLFAGTPNLGKNSRVVVLGYSPGTAGQINSTIDVSGTTSNGQNIPIGSFWANSANSKIIVGPSDLNSITLKSSNGVQKNIPLDAGTKEITVTPALESTFTGDMLWGFGANRKLALSNFHVETFNKATIPSAWDQQYKNLIQD
jgi:hypothetical protein